MRNVIRRGKRVYERAQKPFTVSHKERKILASVMELFNSVLTGRQMRKKWDLGVAVYNIINQEIEHK